MKKNLRPKESLRLGTRTSLLALRQANWVKSRVEELCPEVGVALVPLKTAGDKIKVPLFSLGGKGLFVKEIQDALRRKEIDLAVHSAKDLPAVIPEDLALIAFPEREDPRDVLISQKGGSWAEIPPGGKVGTSSLRRQAQLLSLRPDLEIVPLRGNLDTRLKKLLSLNLEAIIVAAAGLRRMGWEERVSAYLEPEIMLPAIGQGILAVEARSNDLWINRLVSPLNHPPTQLSFLTERAFLQGLGGGCQVPIAGLARLNSGVLQLAGLVATVDGKKVVRGEKKGAADQGPEMGRQLADELLAKGAKKILNEVYTQE